MFNFCNNVIFEVSVRDGGSITCIFLYMFTLRNINVYLGAVKG
jgi:hypothetical protein